MSDGHITTAPWWRWTGWRCVWAQPRGARAGFPSTRRRRCPPASQHGVKKAWNVLEEGELEDGPRGQLSTEDSICRSCQGTGAP